MITSDDISTHAEYSIPQRPPWRNIALLLGLILLGMSVGNLLALGLVSLFLTFEGDISLQQVSDLLQHPEQFPHAWWYMMLIQAIVHVFTFFLPGVIYWRWSEQHRVEEFVKRSLPSWEIFGLSLLIILVFMPFNSWVIEWNSQLHLPSPLKRIEQWMLRKEQEMAQMTQFFTSFTTFTKFMVALLVIAVIPSIGEEVLFRGVIQRKIFHKINNVHLAVWVSAALFSAIHVQFYGFVPRMLLGAMFGYLYAWTRNLWVPIFAHFVNNSVTLLLVFLSKRQLVDFEIQQPQSSVPLGAALGSLGLTLALLYYLRNNGTRFTFVP